jgi:hypothetical protein
MKALSPKGLYPQNFLIESYYIMFGEILKKGSKLPNVSVYYAFYTDRTQIGFDPPLTLRYTKPMLSYGKVV